jgi:hypothetical protein
VRSTLALPTTAIKDRLAITLPPLVPPANYIETLRANRKISAFIYP